MQNSSVGRAESIRRCNTGLLVTTALVALGMAGPAVAQPQTTGQPATETVTVTASRAAPSGYQAPTPTVMLGQDLIEQQQVSNLGSLLNTLPSFKATISPAASGVRT